MPVIQNPLLTIEDISGTNNVRVTVRYTVVQHPLEYFANTLYQEKISLIGDDAPFNPAVMSGTDITVAVFPPYSMRNPHAPNVPPPIFAFERQRVLIMDKNGLDEDPGFTSSGMRRKDELFALIKLTFIANVPFPFQPGAVAATAQTNTVNW
ncbi:hypothetical protein VU07_00625 [Desulfobulbus sp. F4]|nr:hypothetical protein [Desulfobulbus sp. F4]